MAEFKVEHKKQLSSEHGSVSQRKGETVLPDNRGQVSQARALTDNRTAQLASDPKEKPNNTGLPNQLKTGIESLSGMSMDHVKVHYNSPQPAQLNAHAYAKGSNIHLAPGQEKHLAHEAWHVVQQAQGRVKPTMQMKTGVPVNDDAGLEKEADMMGAKALGLGDSRKEGYVGVLEPNASLQSHRAAAVDAPSQRVLIVDNVPSYERSGGLFKHRTFDDMLLFKNYISEQIPSAKANWDRLWSTPIMGKYLALVNARGPSVTVDLAKIAAGVREAVVDAERLDTLDPRGPVPEHHELATFAEEPDYGLHGHSAGPVGYASKMMGKPNERDDFAKFLQGVGTVVLTTGSINDVAKEMGGGAFAWKQESIPAVNIGGGRRPGLSIINYSNAIYRKGSNLAVCGVRGKILMDQFGLAIREFEHAKTGRSITIRTIFNADAVSANYSRLLGFFKKNSDFQKAHTVVFGYASAFEDEKFKTKIQLITKNEDNGWVGYLFDGKQKGVFAVFDSDLTHSYHGEILAQNVKLLMEDDVGQNVQKVIIGGSAGSLVAPGHGGSNEGEESLVPNGIYIPSSILRPDGFFKKNALSNVEMSGENKLATIPGSMHTSVVSVLAETPSVLADLVKYGVKTVDMEFAYVALVLGEEKPPAHGRRDLADVKLGVACLVTDFPKTGAHGVALAEKNEAAKKATKALFVSTVIASMS
jgi:hypothetical protein